MLWPAAAAVAGLSAAAAVAAQWGRVSLKWDVLAQFGTIWLLFAACALATWFMFRGVRRWLIVAVSLIGVVAAGSLVAPEFLRSNGPHAPSRAPDQLKLVQFNVWHENPHPEAILAWLDAERPDVAVIEENSPQFLRALADHPGWSVACPGCEVVILSRTPALAVDSPPRRKHFPPAPLTRAVFRDRGGLFTVIGVHNAWPTDRDQPYQERRLLQMVAGMPKDRLIVTGDFNSTPWSFARRRWDQALGLARRERGVATWPAQNYGRLKWLGMPFLPIDHVYAGPDWATVSVRRGPRLTSDHYPLVVTLARTPALRPSP
jgi:endonuclease/exonuclease/phosphatase (EEP) superfamily protein YafD